MSKRQRLSDDSREEAPADSGYRMDAANLLIAMSTSDAGNRAGPLKKRKLDAPVTNGSHMEEDQEELGEDQELGEIPQNLPPLKRPAEDALDETTAKKARIGGDDVRPSSSSEAASARRVHRDVPMSREELKAAATKNAYLSTVLIPHWREKQISVVLERKPVAEEVSHQPDKPRVSLGELNTPSEAAHAPRGHRNESVRMSRADLKVEAEKNVYLSSVLAPVRKQKPIRLALERKPVPEEVSHQPDVPHVSLGETETQWGTAFGSFAPAVKAILELPPPPAYIFNPYFKGMNVDPALFRPRQMLSWGTGKKPVHKRKKRAKVEPPEPPSMQTIAKAIGIISQMYATLDDPLGIPKAFWGLSKETDRVAARYLKFPNLTPDMKQKSLAEESRFPVLGVRFGTRFNTPVNFKPGIKKIHFGKAYNKPTILPQSVIEVEFGRLFNHPVILPTKVRKVQFCRAFNHPVALPDTVTEAAFGTRFNQRVRLPPKLRTLVFGTDFNTQLPPLPETLEEITFKKRYNYNIVLPRKMKVCIFGRNYRKPVVLPPTLERLQLGKWQKIPAVIPPTIQELSVHRRVNIPLTVRLPHNCRVIKR